jgi:two-component system nitrogen regulation sensor histidine kinase GlnL
LLERELDDPQLREYTQVIIAEADRLQELMNRLLTSHRMMQPTQLNLHDVIERVRRLILAEFPSIEVRRDYDTSLPYVTGDREQLIQAILNIARNAAQAMQGSGEIVLRTRAARQVTLAKRRFKLAVQLQVIDNGPGIPDDIRDKIFYPLVSGRERQRPGLVPGAEFHRAASGRDRGGVPARPDLLHALPADRRDRIMID